MAAGRLAMKHHAPSSMLRSTVAGVRSRVSGAARRRPGDDADRGPSRRGRRAHAARPLRVLPGDRRPDLAQRDRRRGRPRARRPPARPSTPRSCAARCSSRSPTSTAAPRPAPPPRPPRPAAPRSGTTPATTSTSGPAATGSSRRSRTRCCSCAATSPETFRLRCLDRRFSGVRSSGTESPGLSARSGCGGDQPPGCPGRPRLDDELADRRSIEAVEPAEDDVASSSPGSPGRSPDPPRRTAPRARRRPARPGAARGRRPSAAARTALPRTNTRRRPLVAPRRPPPPASSARSAPPARHS